MPFGRGVDIGAVADVDVAGNTRLLASRLPLRESPTTIPAGFAAEVLAVLPELMVRRSTLKSNYYWPGDRRSLIFSENAAARRVDGGSGSVLMSRTPRVEIARIP